MDNRQSGINQVLKMFFGIFMVLVYLGVGVLMAINFFDWPNVPLWNAVRWVFAAVLCAYGIYRGYRELHGEHTYGMRRYDEDEESQYTTYANRLKDIENHDEKK